MSPIAIDVGDLYRCEYTNLSPAKAPVTAGTMTLTVTLPDGTAAAPVVVVATTPGVYQYDYQTVQPGLHRARWVGTGANPGAQSQVFDVRPADIPFLISVADAKDQLKITGTASDETVRSKLEAVTDIIERHLGMAVVRRTFTEEHLANGALVLNWSPVISLTSLSRVDGTYTWDVNTLHVSRAGVVTSPFGVVPSGRVTVSYIAGMSIVPRSYSEAAEIILQNLWETRRGARGGPRPGNTDGTTVRGSTYALPHQAEDLLGSGMPGIA